MKPEDRKCPDCRVNMVPIKLIDQTHPLGKHQLLGYALASAQRSSGFWGNGTFPIAGTVAGYVCERCDRILLYGIPHERQPGAGEKMAEARVAHWEADENGFFASLGGEVVFWNFEEGLVQMEWESEDEASTVKQFLAANPSRHFGDQEKLEAYAQSAERNRNEKSAGSDIE